MKGPKQKPIEERFWPKVQKAGNDECWEWSGFRLPKGYGTMGNMGPPHKKVYAHRVAWEVSNGPIPDGMHVLHRCDNPPCVNPRHLFLGTLKTNSEDMVAKGRSCRGERHGAVKLSDDDVRWVREWRNAGWTLRSLGLAVGCADSHIYKITKGIRRCAA